MNNAPQNEGIARIRGIFGDSGSKQWVKCRVYDRSTRMSGDTKLSFWSISPIEGEFVPENHLVKLALDENLALSLSQFDARLYGPNAHKYKIGSETVEVEWIQ